MEHSDNERFCFLDILRNQYGREHGGDQEGRNQRAHQGVPVGSRHRPENLAFDAFHGEQWDESGNRDERREKHGLFDLRRADENQPHAVGPTRAGGWMHERFLS